MHDITEHAFVRFHERRRRVSVDDLIVVDDVTYECVITEHAFVRPPERRRGVSVDDLNVVDDVTYK